jgi:hypothetical protein
MFAFSHKEFVKPGQHTSVMRAAVDAFNIFDLVVEIWKNLKWIWLAIILRRPYARTAQDGRFDVWGAVNGKRDVGAYGHNEAYAMLDVPAYENPPDSGDADGPPGVPHSLQVPQKRGDLDVEAQSVITQEDSDFGASRTELSEHKNAKAEEAKLEDTELPDSAPPQYVAKTSEYSNTYGNEDNGLR